MPKITVSIIIVYFSGWKDFEKCLQSIKLYRSKYLSEVIIVNNGRKPIKNKILKILPKAIYIKNKLNNGYGTGNNLGTNRAKGKYLFILNPDVELQKNAIDTLIEFLESNAKAAVAAPNLLFPNGQLYKLVGSQELNPLTGIVCHSFINKLFPNNPISRNYFMYDVPITQLRKAFAVPGCAFMIKRDLFNEVGKFDENIFLYYEESDLGKRIQNVGYEEYIVPKAEIIHNHSFDDNQSLKKYNAESRIYYFKKHYGIISMLLVEFFCRFSKRKAIIAGAVLLVVLLLYI